ncbi:hypothetical protein OAF56_01705 [Pirellulaceae bacterium]|nr:hypothetical protein [Pirellulaceae bacterium]
MFILVATAAILLSKKGILDLANELPNDRMKYRPVVTGFKK